MSNQIAVSSDHLECVNERLIVLAIDAKHAAMAVQAAQIEDPISQGIINTVMTSLFALSNAVEGINEELDCMLTTPTIGGTHDGR